MWRKRTQLWAAADLIVEHEGGIVLVKRGHEPWKGMWAMPGGGLDIGEETIEHTAIRELKEETGLTATKKNLTLFNVYSDPRRDPRGHVISHVFIIRGAKGKLKNGSDAADIKVVKGIPKTLASDHAKILRDYQRHKDKL